MFTVFQIRAAERKVVGLRAGWIKARAIEAHVDTKEEDQRAATREKRKVHARRVQDIKAEKFRSVNIQSTFREHSVNIQ
jgi:hypothetical protein